MSVTKQFKIVNPHILLEGSSVRAQQNGWLQCAAELEKALNREDEYMLPYTCKELIKVWRWAGNISR